MKLKTVTIEGKTYAEIDGDKPIYEGDDGKPIAFDAPGTVATISRLNGEAKSHREAKEAAEGKLKAFEGITDPAAAIKALDTVKNIDAKKLIDAGEVETVKAEISKAFQTQLDEANAKAAKLEQSLYGEKIGGSFARSKFLADKAAVPADMVQARFGQNFKIEEGKVVAYDQSGNKVYSRSKPGEAAEFEEALEILIDQYPYKDNILKGTGGGSGGKPGNGGGNGDKTMSRIDFEKLDPAGKAKAMTDKIALTD